jgi:hypothetical protein
VVHKAEAVIKKDERKNISEGLRFAIIEGQVGEGKTESGAGGLISFSKCGFSTFWASRRVGGKGIRRKIGRDFQNPILILKIIPKRYILLGERSSDVV